MKTILLLEMPELMKDAEIRFAMAYRDHAYPHIHAQHQNFNSVIEIDSLTAKGNLPPQRLKTAVLWVKLNQAVLRRLWTAMQNESHDPNAHETIRILKLKLRNVKMRTAPKKKRSPRKKAPVRRRT